MALQTSASNERQIREVQDRAKKDAEVTASIIRAFMTNSEGRRWIWLQLSFCRVFSTDSGVDFGTMAFEKGLRNYGLKLLADVTRYAPDQYITMTREQSGVELKEDPDGGYANDPD